MLRFIENIGDYFATNYFDEDFPAKVFDKSGYAAEGRKAFNKRISALKDRYYRYKQTLLEERLRPKDRIRLTHDFHTHLLNALGYPGDQAEYDSLFHLDPKEVVPVRHRLYRGDRPHLFVMEMQPMVQVSEEEPEGLFEQVYRRAQWENVFRITEEDVHLTPSVVNDAISALFLIEQHRRPHYILLLAGNEFYLLQYEKWFKGSYLRFQLEELFAEASTRRDYYSLFYFLLSKEALAPASDIILMEQLDEDSHKSAYAVTKDLKEGIIHAVEALANEAVWYLEQEGRDLHSLDDSFAQELKDDCLTLIYRLLFLFYAESRPDLEILPINDPVYQRGYSLEMLRDLEQSPLNSEHARNSYFFHDSLSTLFRLLSTGYRENEPQSDNKSFRLRFLDSPLFDDDKLHHLREVRFRNFIWQEIIRRLSLSRQQRGRARGRISYANLGVNQLGSVYEGLLAYRGFFAEQDYIEVHKKKKPEDGTFLVPRTRLGDFKPEEILHDEEGRTVVHPRGAFIYRLSGRDRQKSASYYTPEVLTRTTVKYTLKPILERLEKGEMEARELLRLKVLEPAMGAAAFHNEAINQLAEAYLNYRQEELGKKVKPGEYQEELQKVKAWIATNNVYGVDLNPTAVELGKLALWLNVIHRDMETPFFGYRLGVGNAVVGAWLKVYRAKDFLFDLKDKKAKKEWWVQAPRMLSFPAPKTESRKPKTLAANRKSDEVYHFLLPDKAMVPSTNIKLLKAEYPDEYDRVKEWRKDFLQPIRAHEHRRLQAICRRIDRLLLEHYQFQAKVNACTQSQAEIWGALGLQDQCELDLRSYEEKERLAANRSKTNAPYFKLKMVMDYWCALWYWDMRHAADLPSREEWYNDLINILDIDLEKEMDRVGNGEKGKREEGEAGKTQGDLFAPTPPSNLTIEQSSHPATPEQRSELTTYRNTQEQSYAAEAILSYTDRKDTLLFPSARRRLVEQYARRYRFFHYQLEFVEVFRERGGFDVIVGNPPWIRIEFEEKGIVAEKRPEVLVRKTSAPQVRKMLGKMMEGSAPLTEVFLEEALGHEGLRANLTSIQNYQLLNGQQTNLYKCVIENGFHLMNNAGYIGLIHPEGIYYDPRGDSLREEVYRRLRYHFQFRNSLLLFSEIRDQKIYSINIYGNRQVDPHFFSISNLFHPSTIDNCFVHDAFGKCPSLKKFDKGLGKYTWDLSGHSERLIKYTKRELEIINYFFEDSYNWQKVKLPKIHSNEIISIIEKLSSFDGRVKDFEIFITQCFDETNSVNDGTIERNTKYPDWENYELIYSGPHLFTGTSFYKTPRSKCSEKSHYDIIDLTQIESHYLPRTNYIPLKTISELNKMISCRFVEDWFNCPKLAFRKMLNQTADRTLNPGILPPKSSHINGIISILFDSEKLLLECAALSSSILLDFFIKASGSSNLYDNKIKFFPLGITEKYRQLLMSRMLMLSCVTIHYKGLWERNFDENFQYDTWSIADKRLKDFSIITKDWVWKNALRNDFERRQALLEIDVISSMALGLDLEELIVLYEVEFPKWNEYEEETFFDINGRIVYTPNNQGLVGVGVDKKTWNEIKDLKKGGKYFHTVDAGKSELYGGTVIIFEAPFNNCNRIQDYEKAWNHFSKSLLK